MSYFVSKYPSGTFSWADFFSTNVSASKTFLIGLFGWTAEDMPTEPGKPDYTMFSFNGRYVAGGSPTFDPKMPSFWNSYITVDNVDETIIKAEKLGGKISMPAMEVLQAGRMATIQDPTGAMVCLWQPKNHIGAGIINTVGAMCWNELYTKDVTKAQEFYSQLFGWSYETPDDMDGYIVIKNNGRSNGGIFALTPEMEAMPPNWTVYFTVKNLDESVKKTKVLGGTICMPSKNISIGKIAMVADPAGATIMLLEMSIPPTEWTE